MSNPTSMTLDEYWRKWQKEQCKKSLNVENTSSQEISFKRSFDEGDEIELSIDSEEEAKLLYGSDDECFIQRRGLSNVKKLLPAEQLGLLKVEPSPNNVRMRSAPGKQAVQMQNFYNASPKQNPLMVDKRLQTPTLSNEILVKKSSTKNIVQNSQMETTAQQTLLQKQGRSFTKNIFELNNCQTLSPSDGELRNKEGVAKTVVSGLNPKSNQQLLTKQTSVKKRVWQDEKSETTNHFNPGSNKRSKVTDQKKDFADFKSDDEMDVDCPFVDLRDKLAEKQSSVKKIDLKHDDQNLKSLHFENTNFEELYSSTIEQKNNGVLWPKQTFDLRSKLSMPNMNKVMEMGNKTNNLNSVNLFRSNRHNNNQQVWSNSNLNMGNHNMLSYIIKECVQSYQQLQLQQLQQPQQLQQLEPSQYLQQPQQLPQTLQSYKHNYDPSNRLTPVGYYKEAIPQKSIVKALPSHSDVFNSQQGIILAANDEKSGKESAIHIKGEGKISLTIDGKTFVLSND